MEELALEFDPMKSQSMQEAFEEVHAHEYTECAGHVDIEGEEHQVVVLREDALADGQVEEDGGQA